MVVECAVESCITKIAPLYNIALVFVVFYLLLKLVTIKKPNKDVYLKPWYFLFGAVGVFLLESLVTALKFFGILTEAQFPRWFNAVFELIIIVLFIYMLFLQINYVAQLRKTKRSVKNK